MFQIIGLKIDSLPSPGEPHFRFIGGSGGIKQIHRGIKQIKSIELSELL